MILGSPQDDWRKAMWHKAAGICGGDSVECRRVSDQAGQQKSLTGNKKPHQPENDQ
jgi:hypothetical protein